MSLPWMEDIQAASLSTLALSSSLPHCWRLWEASWPPWPPTWLILETNLCPKAVTAAPLMRRRIKPVSTDRCAFSSTSPLP